jgi:hypothetical protein
LTRGIRVVNVDSFMIAEEGTATRRSLCRL